MASITPWNSNHIIPSDQGLPGSSWPHLLHGAQVPQLHYAVQAGAVKDVHGGRRSRSVGPWPRFEVPQL